MMRIQWRDPGTWTALSLGLPLAFALGVLAVTYVLTERPVYIPDPNSPPLVATSGRGDAVLVAGTFPPATPTPIPRDRFLPLQGLVVDELGAPLPGVCIEIGPNGCRRGSPVTDGRGIYFFDFAPADVDYDIHYTKDGYAPIVRRLKLTQKTVLNVVMGR